MARGLLAVAVGCVALASMPVGVLGQKNIGSYDYIVVGSGPGGATVANYLTVTNKYRVLLLEAGADYDNGAATGRTEKMPKPEGKDALPRLFYTVPTVSNPRAKGDDMFMGGRVMGGSSSLSANQWIRPSDAYLAKLQEAVKAVSNKTDPDWDAAKLKTTLIELEKFTGSNVDTKVHGAAGRVPVRMPSSETSANGLAKAFIDALGKSSGMEEIKDYNDPATPTGVFTQWQLSQFNDGDRASASNSMLGDARTRYNLFIRPRATVLYVNFENQTAKGVTFMQDGQLFMTYARREIILAAGLRTSLILESSGVGSPAKIQQHVKDAGRKMVIELPGVGEGLQNEGFLTMTFLKKTLDQNEGSSAPPNPWDLSTLVVTSCPLKRILIMWGFLPFPIEGLDVLYTNNATDCLQDNNNEKRKGLTRKTERVTYGGLFVEEDDTDPLCSNAKPRAAPGRKLDEKAEGERQRHLHTVSGNMTRFSQWFGTETPSTLSVSVVYLGAGSKGNLHIQSPDPTMLPLVDPNFFGGSHDVEYTCGMVQYQMLPFVEQLLADNSGMELLSPTLKDLGKEEKGRSCSSTLKWVFANFRNAHHWFGAAKMDRRSKNGVVDNNGRVHGLTNLRIADASILPVKPDGGMQVPAYLIGATIAKKILAGH